MKMDLLCAAIGYLAVCICTCGTHAAITTRHLMYSSSAVSWNTAYATCSHMKGHLITVDNNVTINALKYIRAQPEAAAVSDNIWMGLHNTAPTLDVPVYVWADCKHLDDNTTIWFPGEPNFVQTDRCIISSPDYEWKTRRCSENHAFFCEIVTNVNCTFEKETRQKCEMEGVRLPGKMTEVECETQCQEDMDGSDVCWAYGHNGLFKYCNLLSGADPYVCETLKGSVVYTTGRRRCFNFSDITGSEVASPADSFPDCSAAVDTASKEPPAGSTTSPTTAEAIIHTLAMTSATPVTTSMTSTPETAATMTTTTIPTTSAITTPTTPSTTVMISTLETTAATTTSAITTSNPTSKPDTTTDTTVAPINSETSAISVATTQDTQTTAETTLQTTSSASDSAVTSSVTTTTASPPTAEITTTDTRSSLITSTTSTAAYSNNATLGAFSPALDTFLSRLEAALTSTRSASTPSLTSLGRHVFEVCVTVQTFTEEERKKRTDDIVTDLTLDKKNLSSYRRKKSSAEDERPSAQRVGGGVAIILLVTAALIIILPDCASILMRVMHIQKEKQLDPAQQ